MTEATTNNAAMASGHMAGISGAEAFDVRQDKDTKLSVPVQDIFGETLAGQVIITLTPEQSARLNSLIKLSAIGLSDVEEQELADLVALRDYNPDNIGLPECITARLINLSSPPPENVFCLTQNGIGCLPKGDIIGGSGKAKNGKTQTEIVFTVALLKGEYMGFKATKQGFVVIYFDMEQNLTNTAKYAQKVHALCDWRTDYNHPRFHAINLRGDNPEERGKLIETAIKALHPDVVFVDGIKDLLSDINNQEQSAEVLNLIMRITKEYGVCLYAVLHENKNDGNLRGSIGTELMNKSAEVWRTKHINGIFEVEQTECRNRPCDSFSFCIDRITGMLSPMEAAIKLTAAQKTDQKIQDTMRLVLSGQKSLQYGELRDAYMELGACSKATAEKHIASAIQRNYINRDMNSIYRISAGG